MRLAPVFALMLLTTPALAQTGGPNDTVTAPDVAPPPTPPPAKPAPKLSKTAMTAAELQKTVDQLTQSNHDLLDLLKKQQAVLEDMQFDRRLQSRQIQSLEERLENTVYEKSELEKKVATLEAEVAHPAAAGATPPPGEVSGTVTNAPSAVPPPAAPAVASEPVPPSTYLPPPEEDKGPGMTWHRLFTLKGTDNLQSDPFTITGRTWRVRWHNQDPAGKVYQNTSALFLNAFPKGDTIPQRVCSKLGSGGDTTELNGPGTFYMKVEASGGSWELAVEDFR